MHNVIRRWGASLSTCRLPHDLMKLRLRTICLLTAAVVIAGCSRPGTGGSSGSGGSIRIKGSDTMVNLGQAWAEAYGHIPGSEPPVVQGGGSGTGVAALINKDTDIAQSSREMKDEEIANAKSKGVNPVPTIVAQDALCVIVHNDNPVDRLTVAQLGDIFSGRITNWEELGGRDEMIVLLSREKNSGTHVFFLEHVLRHGKSSGPEQYSPSTQMQPSSQTLVTQIAVSPGGIGYVGLGYAEGDDGKELAEAGKPGEGYTKPTVANVMNRTYPISRPLLFYTNGSPTGNVRKFVDFVLSKEGQDITEQMEFVPVNNP